MGAGKYCSKNRVSVLAGRKPRPAGLQVVEVIHVWNLQMGSDCYKLMVAILASATEANLQIQDLFNNLSIYAVQ